jgi:hypothetical protein
LEELGWICRGAQQVGSGPVSIGLGVGPQFKRSLWCGEKMSLLRDDVGDGFFQCKKVWTDVLYFVHGTGAEEMVRASIWVVSDMPHGDTEK